MSDQKEPLLTPVFNLRQTGRKELSMGLCLVSPHYIQFHICKFTYFTYWNVLVAPDQYSECLVIRAANTLSVQESVLPAEVADGGAPLLVWALIPATGVLFIISVVPCFPLFLMCAFSW